MDKEAAQTEAVLWARKLLETKDFVILDTETTGLATNSQVVSIGIMDAYGHVLLDALVNPGCEIPSGASAIHHIYDQHVEHSPTFPEIYPLLVKLLTGRTVVIYNAQYDTGVLFSETSDFRHGLPPIEFESTCAMLQYAKFVGEWNEYRGDFKWQKLRGGDHTAIGDCRATLNLIEHMASTALPTQRVPAIETEPRTDDGEDFPF